jgi:hypothetical protein
MATALSSMEALASSMLERFSPSFLFAWSKRKIRFHCHMVGFGSLEIFGSVSSVNTMRTVSKEELLRCSHEYMIASPDVVLLFGLICYIRITQDRHLV